MLNNGAKYFLWSLIALGTIFCLLAVYYLPYERFDFGLLFLVAITILLNSQLSIQVPGSKVHFMMGDALIFLTLLLYGGEAAILLAAAEAFCTSLKLKIQGVFNKFSTVLQNAAIMACSTAGTYAAVLLYSQLTQEDRSYSNPTNFFILLGVIALMQFGLNSCLVATIGALKTGSSAWKIWNEKLLGVSWTHVVGAAFAGMVYKLIENISVLAIIIAVLIVGLLYFAYRSYLAEIKLRQEQAEQAEQERAAAERERAAAERRRIEEAERHIAELSQHIAEQKRISEALKVSKENFEHAALHDALTDLPNRTFLFDQVRQLLNQNKCFCLFYMDLNGFKKVNDSLGHNFGDKLLVKVGQRLVETVREGDVVARLGGDEFAIILNGMSSADGAFNFGERIKKSISTPFSIENQQIITGSSIGIVVSSSEYQTPEEILRDADIAQYHAKENKTGCSVFDRELRVRAISNIKLENDLYEAIKSNELRAFYQPIISLADNSLVGFEALIRWQHPLRGLVSPAEFIPIAESTGLIVPITLWMLREATQQLKLWNSRAVASNPLYVSVNLSSKHFAHASLAGEVEEILTEVGLKPEFLKLELTESAVMENAEVASGILQTLRNLGVQLSIDDFGTGYSSLSHLHSFPLDTLKIDRSFINRIGRNGENSEIIQTIITLAKSLKMEVVAEGIETSWQAEQLQRLGCQYAQGFFFSKPLPNDEIDDIFEKKRNWLNKTVESNGTKNGNSGSSSFFSLLKQNQQMKFIRTH